MSAITAKLSVVVVDESSNYEASGTPFDRTSLIALLASGLLIFTTIHAQDFADADGDRRSGRRTLPIIAPEGSRVYILVALPLWSIMLSVLWGLGPLSAVMFSVWVRSSGVGISDLEMPSVTRRRMFCTM